MKPVSPRVPNLSTCVKVLLKPGSQDTLKLFVSEARDWAEREVWVQRLDTWGTLNARKIKN